MLVALDGRVASEGALDFVRALRSRVGCDVTFLRLYWPMEEYRRLGLNGPRELFAPDPDVVEDLGRAQRARVGVLSGVGAVTHAIEPAWGDPASSLLEAAREHGSNLLVMGAESRHGLSRLAHPPVAERVAKHVTGIPVVFVPAPTPATTARAVPSVTTVLAATDFSPASNRAVPFAYALVAAHGGVVELCHVHERPLPVPAFSYDRAEGKLTAPERTRIEGELRALIPPDAERLGITTHISVVDGGTAAEAIVQAAERMAVDASWSGRTARAGYARCSARCHRQSRTGPRARCSWSRESATSVGSRMKPRARGKPRAGFGHYLRDMVYGALDGVITTLAVVSGSAGAGTRSANRAHPRDVESRRRRAVHGREQLPGAQDRSSSRSGGSVADEMPWRHGLATFAAFAVVGAVPLFAYAIPRTASMSTFSLAVVLAVLVLVTVGGLRARYTQQGRPAERGGDAGSRGRCERGRVRHRIRRRRFHPMMGCAETIETMKPIGARVTSRGSIAAFYVVTLGLSWGSVGAVDCERANACIGRVVALPASRWQLGPLCRRPPRDGMDGRIRWLA